MREEIEKLEVVFYSSPIPHDINTLTFLGLVFDRVHFPNVHIPTEGFDPDSVRAEIKRISDLNLKDYDTWQLVEIMKYALCPELREFCFFSGKPNQVRGGNDEDTKKSAELIQALYHQVHGPPRADFMPTFIPANYKGLSDDQTIVYPGPFFYQSEALLYSAKHKLPLLNADPFLPVPSLSGKDARNNTKLLSAIMAIECVRMALPEIGGLQPRQIAEARVELSPYLGPFRLAMLRLSAKLNAQIEKASEHAEILEAAKFIVETEVYPALIELKNEIAKPSKGWLDRSWDATKKVPVLVAAFSTFNVSTTIPAVLIALGSWLKDNFTKKEPKSDLYYLLKMQDRVK